MEIFTRLTQAEQKDCWSMLMNLNDEAIRYEVQYQAYDNSDVTIAKRLGLNPDHVCQYLCKKSKQHIKTINNKIKINEIIEKGIRRSTGSN